MKKPTFFKIGIVVTILLMSLQTIAQNFVPFTPEFNRTLKGDIRLIGNNILGPHRTDPYHTDQYNHLVNMIYVDVDNDNSTFNSSSAELEIPNDGCYQIVHAGLYWGAVNVGPTPKTTVKFKGPTGGYNDITGTIIYDAGSTSTGNSYPYACYADVTSIVSNLGVNLGYYTVANVSTGQGRTQNAGNGTGHSAGWSLFVVYEDPTLPGKYITSFDGFSSVNSSNNVTVPISGFTSPPAPIPVVANFAFAALEGDKPISGDFLRINNYTQVTPERAADNFFNSTVTKLGGGLVNNRIPNSTNTLGFDTGIFKVNNPANQVINNGDTSANIYMGSNQDQYFAYFFAFAVDVIEPKIVLTKIVEDDAGNDIGGQTVPLGMSLNYVIGIQNTGNDDANNLIIRDILPINVNFNYPSDLGILPPGITSHSYNPATRELIFHIDNSIVQQNDPVTEIRIHVQVVESCNELSDMCSNIINNQAFATYSGIENPNFEISDDPSVNVNTGCLLIPQATNFLADLDDCIFSQNETLCGNSVELVAADGYDGYTWSSSPTGIPVIGTGQTLTVTEIGTYYVHNDAVAPCQSIDQIFVVTNFGGATVTNPVIPFADEVVTCPNNGKPLPNIFLCGANDFRLIETNITDASSIVWEQLVEGSCAPVGNTDCANENTSCTWTQVGTGPTYNANSAGQFRLTINYEGGCFNQYYFNVYQNVLNPTATSNDIICDTPGQITVGGVPNGYEYSIDGVNYQASNIFVITTGGTYTIYIRQVGVASNPCIFTVPDVQVRERNFTVSTIVNQPLCNGDKGNIHLAANDVRPQYFFSIYNGATLVNSVGPITENNYVFSNLSPGIYTTVVETEDGCTHTQDIEIIEPSLLTATSALTSPLTCTDGEITVYANGGTPPYFYFVNGDPNFQIDPEIIVTGPGNYNILVIDSNNCEATTTITVAASLAPEYTVDHTNILCAGSENGSITINVSNANGNSLMYSIDGGTTFVNANVFTGLSAGDYDVVVQYTTGPDVCVSDPQTITITEVNTLTGTATLTAPYTCTSNGEITVSGVSGGTPPYTYSIDGVTFQNGTTFTGLANGTYTVTIQDSSGCAFIADDITIAALTPPTDLTFDNTALTCPLNTSTVTITGTTGGFGTLEYQITAPAAAATPYQTSNVFTNLAPGTYTFQVMDENECTYSESYTIVPLPALTVVGQTTSNVTCFGEANGAAQFTVSGSTGFNYTINGGTSTAGTSPIVLTGLAAGTYTILVIDTTTNCEATATVTVEAPTSALSISTTVSPITCNGDGQVVINSTGGWGGNTYSITLPDGTVIPAQNSNTFTNLSQTGTYTAMVTDANGCSESTTFELVVPTSPTATIAVSDYCYDSTNSITFEVTATGGQVPYEYNINGGPFTSNNIFTGLTPGSYTISVRDAYGCITVLPIETIADQLVLNTLITKDLDCTVSPDAVITGTVSGGYAPFTYEISINGGAYTTLPGNPFPYSAANAGTYQFQVTDDRGCSATSDVITVNPIENPTATTTVVNATCHGSADGSVQIVPSGGVGPYTYSFEGSPFTSTSIYTGLAAGTYTYQVQDAKDCIFDGTVTITEPTALVVSATATSFSCSASNTAQPAVVTIDIPTTGTAPYTYSFNGSAYTSTNTLTVNDNGTDQTITYSVKDANGCIQGGSITISRLDGPTNLDFSATPVTCLDTESDVTLTATNGVGVLSYAIISPIAVGPQASNVFTGLLPGTYVFQVTDENGCYYTESLTINPVINITVSGVKLSDVLCFGDNSGAIQFTVANTTGFTYTINGGPSIAGTSPLDITGLIAGDYTILVTDTATGCTATETITITQPTAALGITAVATHVYCNEYESQITVTATNGTPNYTYAAVISGNPAPSNLDYSTNNPITVDTNLGADLVWDVYVKDANGCIETTTVTIVSDELPTVTAPVVDNQCTATSGFTFTAIGTGVAPLQYSINGGAFQNSPTFVVNAAGTYSITIKDGNGCTATSSTNTQVFEPITVNALLTKDLTCSLPLEASITITASGGNPPYTYEVSTDGGVTYTSIPGSPYTTTIAGTYQFRITDANGCEKITNEVIVNPAINPEITAVVIAQDINCSGEETGAINITIDTSLGLAPFVINVFNNTTGINYGTQTSGLAAGNYTITVTDAKGCTDTETITIVEPDPIDFDLSKVDITCNNPGGSELGSITVENVSGGTGPFTYYISNNFGDVIAGNPYSATTNEDHTFIVINYGIYTINVIDANGCSLQQQITIASPPSDLQIDIISTVIDCSSGGTAIIEAISVVGSGNYEFGILEFNTPPYTTTYYAPDTPGGAIRTFTNLIPGVVYTFVVHDLTTDCYYVKSADHAIPPSSPLTSTVVPNNVTCQGENNGSVTFTIDNFDSTTTSVDYQIFIAYNNVPVGASNNVPVTFGTPVTITTPSPGTLAPGQYYIVFSENGTGTYNGCESASVIFEIRESAVPLEIDVLISKNENCNELGVMSATGSNGTAPYQYQVVATGATPDPTGWGSANTFNLPAGTYDVYVMDVYGCAVFDTQTIIRDAEPTIDPVAQQCFNGTPFTITLTGTTFNGEATYSIGGAYQLSPNFTITAAGTYTISIKDANGCIATDTFIVAPPLLLDAVLDLDLTCDVDASITLSASGGTGIYNTYQVSSDGGATYSPIGSTTFTTTIAGTYIFMVTDSQGCTAVSNAIIITPNTTPTLTHIQTNVSCNGVADGSIVVTAANGLVPYQYSINGGPFQLSNVFNGLAAGTYDIVVRDSKNCTTATTTVTITEPTLVDGTMLLTQGLTCGAGNAPQPATVTITGSGGTPPYTYSFDGVNYTATNTYVTYTPGTVTAYVKDANGCIIDMPLQVVIPALSVPTDLDFSSTPVTCLNTESVVTLTATDGVGVLTYEIISPATATGNTTGATTGIFTGLAPDTYVFTVTDENGCYYTESYTVTPVTNITVSGSLEDDINCNAGNDGAVTFIVGNFSGTYSYEINNNGTIISGQTDPIINLTGLSAGDQTIVVTDETTGCTTTYTVTISEPTTVSLVEIANINANCNFGAQVTVEASGGTPPYQYAFVLDGSAPVAANYTNSNTAVLDPAMSINWDVWVMDSNGCTSQIDVVIATDPLPMADVPTFAINQCTVASGFEFTVTNPTGIAPFTYSIGNGFQSSPTFIVATAGTYTIIIKDANGCTNAIPMSIDIYPALALTPNVTALASCADDDGEITVNAVGGSGTYIYSISPNPASISLAGNIFSGVPSGTYTVTIEDALTGCTEDTSITLEAATPVDFTVDSTNVSCNNGNDGTITVNLLPGNDNPIYTYEITAGPITFAAQNSNVFTGLTAGTYTVQVNSGRGCVDTKEVIITEPLLLEVSGIATDFACAADGSVNTSVLTITEVGGTAPYTFSINGTNYFNSNVFDIIDTGVAQTLTVYVKDANGCIATNTVTILPLPTLIAATVVEATPIDCNNTGSIAITVTGGSGNFEYEMLPDGLPQASNIFDITLPGSYYFLVTDLDTGCTIATAAYTVAPFDLVDVIATATTGVTCFGDTNGAFEISVTGYSGAYNYEVFDSAGNPILGPIAANTNTNPISVTGLSGGNYTVTITETDSPFCATTTNVVTITSPSEALDVVALETSNVTCTDDLGTITATASGGWGAYQYELVGPISVAYSSTNTFANLTHGTYTVNVMDAGGCIASDTVTLVIPNPINATVTASATLLSCFGDSNATITATNVTGGQGSNYLYTLNMLSPTASTSGPQSSPVFENLGAGTYQVVVTDAYSCSFTSPTIVINQPTQVLASLVKASSQTCLTESTLTLSASGGTGPYTYSANSTFTPVLGTFATSVTFSVPVGTYQYYVQDSNGCVASVSNQITIDPLPSLTINLDVTNGFINCTGDTTGVVVAVATGGLGNYVYTLQDTAGNTIPATQNSPGVFTQLAAGNYVVYVESGDCLITTAPFEITEPLEALTAQFTVTDVTCYGAGNGTLEINASGGTGVIKYAISPQLNQFFDTNVFENLAPGTYDVIVQDELGCYLTFNFTITEPTPVVISIVPGSIFPEVCEGDLDGEFSIEISGGTAPYSVSLDSYNGPYTTGTAGQTLFDFTNLGGGDHIVYVRDSFGCESEWNISFPESVRINPLVEIEYACVNNAQGNVVTVIVDDSITDHSEIDYSLNGGPFQPSNIFIDVVPGIGHYIDVRHTNGCIQRTPLFDIIGYDPLTLALNDGEINEIVAVAAGGSGGYQYTLNGVDYGSTNVFIISESGTYTVTVTDSNGCVATASRHFDYVDVCIPNYFTPNGDGNQDGWAPGCTIHYPNLDFDIFDRYGRKIATLRIGQSWDGTYNGKELPSGDYWYVVRLNDAKDNRSFVGHFTLYR